MEVKVEQSFVTVIKKIIRFRIGAGFTVFWGMCIIKE